VSRGARLVLLVVAAGVLAGSEAALGDVIAPEGRNLMLQEDQPFSGVVASFQSRISSPPESFTAEIPWGDGAETAGTVVGPGPPNQQRLYPYTVEGSHTYNSGGTFTIVVTITDTNPQLPGAGTANGTATVAPRQQPPPPPAPPPPPPPPPQANLVLTQAHAPAQPRAGQALTFTFTIGNLGPNAATAVQLVNDPPDGSTFVSASDGCTSPPEGPLTCQLGTLAAGANAAVTHVVRLAPGAVPARNSAQVSAAEADPVTSNNATAAELAVVLPPPVLGRAVNVSPVRGVVLFRPRGAATFQPLTQGTQIPTGSQIDTRRGRVRLQSARGGGPVDTADFYQGVFAVFQAGVPGAFTELRLVGGRFGICPAGLRRPTSHPQHPIRRLWGSGKGRFRTRGRFSSATIRGTRWLTLDRCEGTLVRVQVGIVLVRDFPARRSVLLRAGQSYLARARR
jgi:uncharacterized repeat protein (TIGR01451 family)